MDLEIQERWDDEWVLRNVGLFLTSKKNLQSWFFKKIRMIPVPVPQKKWNSRSSSGKFRLFWKSDPILVQFQVTRFETDGSALVPDFFSQKKFIIKNYGSSSRISSGWLQFQSKTRPSF